MSRMRSSTGLLPSKTGELLKEKGLLPSKTKRITKKNKGYEKNRSLLYYPVQIFSDTP